LKTAPEVYFKSTEAGEDSNTDSIWLSVNWNLSLVEKYSQCVDTIEVMIKRAKDSKTQKLMLCSHPRSSYQNCSGSLLK